MTREEAIEYLKQLHQAYEILERERPSFTEWYLKCKVALTIATEALEADRSRGKWTKATESIWKCSLCDAIMFTDSNYCPNCGAKMDGERSEE